MIVVIAVLIGIAIGVMISLGIAAIIDYRDSRPKRFRLERDFFHPCGGSCKIPNSHVGRPWVVQTSEVLIARAARRLLRKQHSVRIEMRPERGA